MDKKILIVLLIIFVVGISGCTINNKPQSTFGEKEPVSVDYLHITNSTTKYVEINGTGYYYISGYIQNTAENNALNVEIEAKGFDENGTLVGTNDNISYIKPGNIPTNGESYFYTRIDDPQHKIVRYELKPLVKY